MKHQQMRDAILASLSLGTSSPSARFRLSFFCSHFQTVPKDSLHRVDCSGRQRVSGRCRMATLEMDSNSENWMDDLIDSVGRENLIVWRQFGRKTTDEDIEFARNVGSTFATQIKKLQQTKGQIGFSSIETIDDAVGVRLIGVNADNMLRLIRPFFQRHFPRGSFVTRSRLWRDDEDENSPEFYWKHPLPLFEDDKITPP